jgi:hypothetical protein
MAISLSCQVVVNGLVKELLCSKVRVLPVLNKPALPPSLLVLANDVTGEGACATTYTCSNCRTSANDGAKYSSAGSANGSPAQGFLLCVRHAGTPKCAGKNKNNKSKHYALHLISPSYRDFLKGFW